MKDDGAFEALLGMVSRAPESRPDFRPGSRLVAHLEVSRVLGRGGMGVVYLANDLRLDRQVAVKIPRSSTPLERRRLHREAKALARLAHPHVVTVHEVGSLPDGGVYIAMEHIDGGTMRDWLDETTREDAEVRRVLVEAGRGLLAAHEAGLVHRDFKPENVLIGQDGRARVSDFGLARPARTPETVDGKLFLEELASRGMGTVGYMAPEQIRGEASDPRVDQFAFAIVCYETLLGQRPFGSVTTVKEALAAIEAGPGARDERPRRLGRVLDDALEKALADDPEERHSDIEPILRALEAPSPARRPPAMAIALSTILLIAAGGFAASRRSSTVTENCAAAGAELGETWRAEARDALAAEGDGEEVARVIALMDRYAESWASERSEVCDERPNGEIRYREQRACLDDLARSFRATASVLASSGTSADLLRGPNRLFAPSLCQNEAFARARAPAPNQAPEAVNALRGQIAEVRALEDAGRYEAAAERAARVVARADALDFAPAQVEALYARGRVEARRGRFKAAAQSLENAYLLARKAPHDRLAAEIGGELAYLHGFNLSDVPTAKRWADLALADMERLGGAGPFEARVLTNVGSAYAWSGEPEVALEQHQRALQLALDHRSEDHFEVALVRARLGETLASMHRLPDAIDSLTAAIANLERNLGAAHPELVRPLTKLGLVMAENGDLERAIAQCHRAVEVAITGLGRHHANTGLAQMNLGVVFAHAGRAEQATAAYAAAVEALEAALDPDHPDIALAQTNLGLAYEEQGQFKEALAMHEKALELQRRRLGPDHPSLVPTMLNKLSALIGLRRFAEAQPLAEAALEICETRYPRGLPYVLFSLGQIQLGQDHHEGALASFDRCLKLRQAEETPPRYLAETLLYTAKAERAVGRRPRRAEDLARKGLDLLDASDDETLGRIRDDLEDFLRPDSTN